jgi:predicted Zn finger-like uncharacterized protein
MIVTCPACKRAYRLEDSLVKSPYQKMRCSRCGHVFVDHREQGKTDEMHLTGPGSSTLSPNGETRLLTRSNRAVMLVVAVLVIFGLAVSGYIYWMNYLGAGNKWLSIQKIEGRETITKDGRVFLINGVVVNGSTKPRKRIILRARLFDGQGAVIGQHLAVAGFPLSAGEIAQMETSNIEARLPQPQKPATVGEALYPRKEMPFSIVLPALYSGKPKEFTVEIVDSPFL